MTDDGDQKLKGLGEACIYFYTKSIRWKQKRKRIMSDISGCSECGQYPRSLFKSDNEINGIQSSAHKIADNSGTDKGRGLEADKVTLSAEATEIAQAQRLNLELNATQNTHSSENKSDADSVANDPPSPSQSNSVGNADNYPEITSNRSSRFYAVV